MKGFFGLFDRLKKLERENRILELQVKNAKLKNELRELNGKESEE